MVHKVDLNILYICHRSGSGSVSSGTYTVPLKFLTKVTTSAPESKSIPSSRHLIEYAHRQIERAAGKRAVFTSALEWWIEVLCL